MTRIDFYTHAANRMNVVCQLAVKALAHRQRVFVFTGGAAATQAVSQALWQYGDTSFLPHCRRQDPLADQTSIIVDHEPPIGVDEQILINLHPDWPAFFGGFERLIEVVGPDEVEAGQARNRFRHYRECGYDIQTHNLAASRS